MDNCLLLPRTTGYFSPPRLDTPSIFGKAVLTRLMDITDSGDSAPRRELFVKVRKNNSKNHRLCKKQITAGTVGISTTHWGDQVVRDPPAKYQPKGGILFPVALRSQRSDTALLVATTSANLGPGRAEPSRCRFHAGPLLNV